jgi:hypothetical protein
MVIRSLTISAPSGSLFRWANRYHHLLPLWAARGRGTDAWMILDSRICE